MTDITQTSSIIIFAKTPQAGKVKTRLIPALGAEQARELAKKMLQSTVKRALAALESEPSLSLQLCVAPDMNDSFWQQFSYHQRFTLSQQIEGDLGARMAHATQEVMARGGRVLLIGSDCPGLSTAHFLAALRALDSSDAVIHPASDGGYVLLGLSRYSASIFSDIPWSTEQVAPLTFKALEQLNYSVTTLAVLNDIDEPDDLQYLPA